MNAEFLVLQPGAGFHAEWADTLKTANYNFRTMPGGWTIFSPSFYKALRGLGMEHAYEVFPKLAGAGGGYFVGDEISVTLICTYLSETQGSPHKFVPVRQLANDSFVYRIEPL